MKKIDILTRDAFNSNTPFRCSNTEVRVNTEGTDLFLYGNHIAHKSRWSGAIRCSLCSWNTPTTRTRLNAIGANLHTRKGVPYHDNLEIPVNDWFYIK